MPKYKFKYDFSEAEINLLKHTLETSAPSSTLHKRAAVLLTLAQNEDTHLTVLEIAEKCETNHTTVQVLKNKLMTGGLESALFHAKQIRKTGSRSITGEFEEMLLAMIQEELPNGAKHWSVRSVAEECVKRGYTESIHPSTVHRYLKKNGILLR